jgi:3'(2'), 5'-bisphosphate nucleotidase
VTAPVYRRSADEDDHRIAHELAGAAGELLVALRANPTPDLAKQGDRQSDDFLQARLAELRPNDSVLSEESADNPARLTADKVWIIDPLDGTREYAELREDWAVHVALWSGGSLVAGAVAIPALGRVHSTWKPEPLPADPPETTLLISRSRAPEICAAVAAEWPAKSQPMGSAGAKVVGVLTGAGTAYVHAGGQYEWDSAAPLAVALEHGLRVRRLDGSGPRYNQPNPYLPDLAVCRPSGADELWPLLDRLVEPTA